MDILRLSVHVCVNLFFYIVHDQSGVTADDFLLFLFVAWYLAEVLLHNIDDEVGIIVGKLTDGVEQHACQRVPGILDFECLCVYYCQQMLVDCVETLDLCCGYLKVLYGTFHFKVVELHLGSCLHENFWYGYGFCRVFRDRFRELLLRHRTFSALRIRCRRDSVSTGALWSGSFPGLHDFRSYVKKTQLIGIIRLSVLLLRCHEVLHVCLVDFKLCLRVPHLVE